MKVLVIGPNVWGRGDTLDEALKKAREFVKFKEVFICHPDTRVTEMGNLEYPEGFRPKKIHERTGTR